MKLIHRSSLQAVRATAEHKHKNGAAVLLGRPALAPTLCEIERAILEFLFRVERRHLKPFTN